MSGFLSCPACGTSNIALGTPACPGCRVTFATPVVNPQFQPAMSAVATAPAAAAHTSVPQPQQPFAGAPASDVAYASIWLRAGAGMIDLAIFTLPSIALYGWSGYWNAPLLPLTMGDLVWTLAWLAYVAIMQSSSWQATLGMRAFGVRIQREHDFSTISPWRAAGRDLLSYLSAIPLMIGYLMIAFTEKRQALHDKLAGTVVLRDPR